MKQRFRLFRRGTGGRYSIHDGVTGRQESLHTANTAEARRILRARSEAERQPQINLQIARAFYEMCWLMGGAQSDIANLKAEDVDRKVGMIAYRRANTRSLSTLSLGPQLEKLLATLPNRGPLFPRLAAMHETHRAKEFRRRCLGLGIEGVSLHSYRYAWAERAKAAGYPERFATEALGDNCRAIHRTYARGAQIRLPSLEDNENAAAKVVHPSFH